MIIPRRLAGIISERLQRTEKIQILYGPRQVGKTTLLSEIVNAFSGRTLTVNADEIKFKDVLSSRDTSQLKRLIAGIDLLYIDEAQQIPDIGINLKLLHDTFKDLKILVTGSSALDLSNRTSEALTGRYWSYKLFPVSLGELSEVRSVFEIDSNKEEFLLFGMYPETLTINNQDDKKEYLSNLIRSYLYKDVLELSGIRNAHKLRDLLRLLAYQIGDLVSYNELGRTLGLSTETIQHYMDLLEKSFVILQLPGFSRNLRKEITKNKKVYFYDTGVRNALIDNFNALDLRPDKGKLWENFLILERMKYNAYRRSFRNVYFWRTYTGAELDYVEESGGKLEGFEFKWGNKRAKAPKTWLDTYHNSTFSMINNENYLAFTGLEPDQQSASSVKP